MCLFFKKSIDIDWRAWYNLCEDNKFKVSTPLKKFFEGGNIIEKCLLEKFFIADIDNFNIGNVYHAS